MTDEQYAEIRQFVRNHPGAVPAGDFGGIPIEVNEDCEGVHLLYSPPRVELTPADYSDLKRRLAAEPL